MKMARIILSVAILTWAVAGAANATLTSIGQASYNSSSYNLVYDDSSPFGSIVYLDYTHAGATWTDQLAWANSLNNILTYTLNSDYSVTWGGDWRLPKTVDGRNVYGWDGTTTTGYNITSSEMGHLFFTELGNKAYRSTNDTAPQPGWGLTNKGPLTNLQSGVYWYDTKYTAALNNVWGFYTYTGYQDVYYDDYSNTLFGMAVRNAVISEVAPVPEPATMILLGSGLIGLAGFSRKKLMQ